MWPFRSKTAIRHPAGVDDKGHPISYHPSVVEFNIACALKAQGRAQANADAKYDEGVNRLITDRMTKEIETWQLAPHACSMDISYVLGYVERANQLKAVAQKKVAQP